jgi:Tat protein secretion system quality control protein TatD with DNase activity
MHEQYRAFEAQLKLAAKWLKPIVIHSRDAYQKTFELMKKVNNGGSSINRIRILRIEHLYMICEQRQEDADLLT